MSWVVCNLVVDRSVMPYMVQAIPDTSSFGQHTTRNDAVRALVTLYHPELVDASLEHIKRVSKEFLRGTHKIHKIVKL